MKKKTIEILYAVLLFILYTASCDPKKEKNATYNNNESRPYVGMGNVEKPFKVSICVIQSGYPAEI